MAVHEFDVVTPNTLLFLHFFVCHNQYEGTWVKRNDSGKVPGGTGVEVYSMLLLLDFPT